MLVLGIESSCDETSAAVVENGKKLLSCKVISSLDIHRKFGGVIPEIASRMQLASISFIVEEALLKAGISLDKINLISVTDTPGLLGSLLVGQSFAKAISISKDIPVLGINHIHSHIYANFLEHKNISFPFVALVVSGGHTSLFYVPGFEEIKLLGSTSDDACGEAFDKVAKLLGLKYPGGPEIEKLAKSGSPKAIKFKCSQTKSPFDFSFSGIKTAVLYLLKNSQGKISKADIAASFQETVIDVLIEKSVLACKHYKAKTLLIGGGVASNSRFRDKLLLAQKINKLNIFIPPKNLCIDNAAMVAGLGYQLYKRNGGKNAY